MMIQNKISFSKTLLILGIIMTLGMSQPDTEKTSPQVNQTVDNAIAGDPPIQSSQNQKTVSLKYFIKPKVKDACIWMKCGKGFECRNGKCVPITCYKDNDCMDGKICESGKCVADKCVLIKCGKDLQCKRGKCVPRLCREDNDCENNLICEEGSCVTNECIWMKCGKGFQCKRGECVPITCTKDDDCLRGKICKSGKCVEGLNICTNQDYRIIYCPERDRLTYDCPLPSFAPPGPAPSFCGVTASGERINVLFPQCSVCGNRDIVYYFDKPCYDVPFICGNQQKCQEYYCSGECSQDSECPFDWQMCHQGRCRDRCMVMRCRAGPCKFGQCQYRVNSPSCQYPQGVIGRGACPDQQLSCFGFSCVNLCDRKACAPSQKCFRGQCLPE